MSERSTVTAKLYGCSPPPRVAVIAAHPDDETLGLGGQLSRIANLTLIHVTDGASFSTPEEYARARAHELNRALVAAGVINCRRRSFGTADQESADVLVRLARELVDELAGMEIVITHAYEGGHPDHDSCAFIVQSACTLLIRARRPAPTRLEFASYHERNGRMATGVFWSNEGCLEEVVPLDAHERARKREALAQFVTQREMIERFPVEVERLRCAPDYDFAQPPPPGSVLYDRFGWRITGEQWREKAYAALATLGLIASGLAAPGPDTSASVTIGRATGVYESGFANDGANSCRSPY